MDIALFGTAIAVMFVISGLIYLIIKFFKENW